MGQALETFLEADSTSEDSKTSSPTDLQVIISGLVQDLNEKDKTIWQLKDTLAKTNLAVIRLQEMMKDVQAQLKKDTVVSEAVPTIIQPIEIRPETAINAERSNENSARTDSPVFNKSDRKKRKNRSPRGKKGTKAKRKSRRIIKAGENLDRTHLRTVFQKRVRKLVAAHNFFTATALKIYEARQNVDKKSYAKSTQHLDNDILKHQIVEKLEDIMARRQQRLIAAPQRSSLVVSTTPLVPEVKKLRWKDDESLHEVHLVEPICDEYTKHEFFYTADEIKLFKFEKVSLVGHLDESQQTILQLLTCFYFAVHGR